MDFDAIWRTQNLEAIKTKLDRLNRRLLHLHQLLVTFKWSATVFPAPNPHKEKWFSGIKESLGKITIVDFKNVIAVLVDKKIQCSCLYNDFSQKGLNISQVSLDKDAAKWKTIARNKWWTQVSNLKFWDDPIAAESIKVKKQSPATFVLDASGKIIAKI
jgi:hypothetical protein